MGVHYENVFKYSKKMDKKDQYMYPHVVCKHGSDVQYIVLKILM